MFKELVTTSVNKVDGYYKFGKHDWSKHTTKLDVAILGLLWCYGTQEQKVFYFQKLANPLETKWITHQSKEMKYVFKKLFYYSIDMAAKFTAIKS